MRHSPNFLKTRTQDNGHTMQSNCAACGERITTPVIPLSDPTPQSWTGFSGFRCTGRKG